MRNTPIQGGRVVGPPPGWDRETQGDCLDLHVLQLAPPFPGMAASYSAWQFSEEEAAALENGGHFVLGVVLPYIPVIRLLVQDRDGKPVGELEASRNGVRPIAPPIAPPTVRADLDRMREVAAALRAAVIAIGRQLEANLGVVASPEEWLSLDNAEAVQRVSDLVNQVRAAAGIKRLPLLTLDDLVKGDQGKGRPFPGDAAPVDPSVQADLERMLGVELNPPPPPAEDDQDGGKADG